MELADDVAVQGVHGGESQSFNLTLDGLGGRAHMPGFRAMSIWSGPAPCPFSRVPARVASGPGSGWWLTLGSAGPDSRGHAGGQTGPQFVQTVTDQLDQLYADSADSGRVMALALHPFVSGQPFRARYLDQALGHVASHPGVWLATSDEIAEHYARTVPA
jgi:hypothetical protein